MSKNELIFSLKEVMEAFKEIMQQSLKKKEKEKTNSFFSAIAPNCTSLQNNDKNADKCVGCPTPKPDDVDVTVTTDDSRLFIVEIKTNEQGVHRYHTGMESKMIFCKTVSVFYKNQQDPAYKFDIRRASAPV